MESFFFFHGAPVLNPGLKHVCEYL